MSRLRLAAFIALSSCGATTGGGFNTLVEYHLATTTEACVKVRASPQTPAGQTKENSFSLKDKPASGTVRFGILIGDDWKGDITITGSLHRPCSGPALASQATTAKAPTNGAVVQLDLLLSEPMTDAGEDGGSDAGEDAGSGDAGVDAGGDAGTDAGEDVDAGRSCDGGLEPVTGPPFMTSTPWHDLAPYPGGVWLAGAGALYFLAPGGWVSAHVTCTGNHKAAWARPDGRVYFSTVSAGLRYVDPDAGSPCEAIPTASGTGDVLGIAGFVDGGIVYIYSATSTGTLLRQTDPDVPALNRRWDLGDAGVGELWTIDGVDEGALFAGGNNTNKSSGVIYKYDPASDSWAPQTINSNSTVFDISVVSGSAAVAGTEGMDLFLTDGGGTWIRVSNNDFGSSIYGVKAFSPTEVYAVGSSAQARRWDGSDWTTLGSFDAGSAGYLSRIKGLSSCDLWTAGSNGLVVRSP